DVRAARRARGPDRRAPVVPQRERGVPGDGPRGEAARRRAAGQGGARGHGDRAAAAGRLRRRLEAQLKIMLPLFIGPGDRVMVETKLEDVDRVMRVNFGGMVNCTLAALPTMVRQGFGRIINVSSAVGRSPVPGEAAYGASKAAVIAFSESISYELEPKGVRDQVLFPGYVPTTGIARQARRDGQ